MARDIRRTVKLLLDKLSAKRVEKDISEALDKGTDAKKPTKNLKAIEGGLGKLKAAAVAVGAALVAAFAAGKVLAFLKDSTKLAAESEEAWTRLAGKVENAGVSYKAVEGDLRRMSDAMAQQSTLGRKDYADVLGILIGLTNNYALSVQNVDLVTDFAAATGKTFVQSAEAIGKALQGDTKILEEFNIEFSEGADIVQLMRDRFAGFAENEAKTFNGRVTQLSEAWRNLKVEIGQALIESGAADEVFDALGGTIQDLTAWVKENNILLREWARIFGELITLALKLSLALASVFQGSAARAAQRFMQTIAGEPLRKQLILTRQEIERLERQFSIPGSAGDVNKRKLIEDLWQEYDRLTASIQNATAAEAQRQGQRLSVPVRGSGGGDPVAIPDAPGVFSSRLMDIGLAGTGSVDQFAGIIPPVNEVTHRITQEMIDAITADIRAGMMSWERFAHVAAFGIADAFQSAFDLLLDGFDNVGDAAKQLGKGIAGALIGGIADYAMTQAAKEIAEGFSMLALSLNPFTPGIGGPSAAAHFAAAAKWAAVAGIAGAVGGQLNGTGGGGGNSGVSEGGTNAQPVGPEINIWVDGIDPHNPRHQALIGEITQYTNENYGPGARVRAGSRN